METTMTTTNGTPTAAETLEDVTLDQLVGLLEAIAIVKHERKILALPRYHQLNGCTFFLDRDGGLAIDERDGQTAGQAHARRGVRHAHLFAAARRVDAD